MRKVFYELQRLWKKEDGQDLIEYALMAASVAVAAGAVFPSTIMPSVSGVFSRLLGIYGQIH